MVGRTISLTTFDYAAFVARVVGCEPQLKVYCVGEILLNAKNPAENKSYDAQRRFFAHIQSPSQNFELKLGYLLKTKTGFQEKGVDTLITMELLIGAYENTYDEVYLFSADSDFVPVIKKVRALGKAVVYVCFPESRSQALLFSCSRYVFVKHVWLFIGACLKK